jgi:hypothetical protein
MTALMIVYANVTDPKAFTGCIVGAPRQIRSVNEIAEKRSRIRRLVQNGTDVVPQHS